MLAYFEIDVVASALTNDFIFVSSLETKTVLQGVEVKMRSFMMLMKRLIWSSNEKKKHWPFLCLFLSYSWTDWMSTGDLTCQGMYLGKCLCFSWLRRGVWVLFRLIMPLMLSIWDSCSNSCGSEWQCMDCIWSQVRQQGWDHVLLKPRKLLGLRQIWTAHQCTCLYFIFKVVDFDSVQIDKLENIHCSFSVEWKWSRCAVCYSSGNKFLKPYVKMVSVYWIGERQLWT